jgi:hypothetical protein
LHGSHLANIGPVFFPASKEAGMIGQIAGLLILTVAIQPIQSQSDESTQIAFRATEGMTIRWDVSRPESYDSPPVVAPVQKSFPNGASYHLEFTNIPDRPNFDIRATLEIPASQAKTKDLLAHVAVPFQLTLEDVDQVMAGNAVTKSIYFPDPEFQELSIPGIETLVSTRLDPGVDPIAESARRGSILAIVRLIPCDGVETEKASSTEHAFRSQARRHGLGILRHFHCGKRRCLRSFGESCKTADILIP